MKIIPSNQTLILANERGSAGGAPGSAVQAALRAASANGALNRVTIVAAQPDASVLYLQADYSTPSPPPSDSRAGVGELTVLTLDAGSARGPVTTTPYHSSRGARLYASTQGLAGGARLPATIDVHA